MQRYTLRHLATAALAFAPAAFAQDAAHHRVAREGRPRGDDHQVAQRIRRRHRARERRRRRTRDHLRQGQAAWQSNPKETEPGAKWTINSIGRDFDGNGQPDVHFSTNTGGANCCVTHHVYELKPKVKRLAAYSAGSMGASDFIDVPGRKSPVMVSADDSSAKRVRAVRELVFPAAHPRSGPKGRMQFAQDMMQTRLPACRRRSARRRSRRPTRG
jgi:hypothetical protein